MLKRNTNLTIKLLLFIILFLLFVFIYTIPTIAQQDTLEEYYYSTKTYEYLTLRNFTSASACGIIGNMMIETSGGTLDIKPHIYSKSGNFYGLCQWSTRYYSGAKDLPFEYQLDFLLGTLPWEFNTFGWRYKKGFTFEDFIQMKDPVEAALAFAVVYERCGPVSYNLRKQAALKAYKYFNQ